MNLETQPNFRKRKFKEKYTYTLSEKILILIGTILFLLMTYVYVTDMSLKRLFFPSAEEKFLSTPIGKTIHIKGSSLRQRAADFEFKSLATQAELYPNDTIMTGPDSFVSIELKDGQKIEITPNSLVKLSFGSDFTITDVVRIEIIQGATKTALAEKKPIPTPSPTEAPKPPALIVHELMPPAKSSFAFTSDEYFKRNKSIKLTFKINLKAPPPLVAKIYLPATSSSARKVLAEAIPQFTGQNATVVFNFNSPGIYEWEIQNDQEKSFAASSFILTGKLNLIQILPTLNSNNKIDGSATKKSFDGFHLRWKPLGQLGGNGKYIVKIYKDKASQILFQKELSATELVLNKNKLLIGKLNFTVERDLGRGFYAYSQKESFGFEFLAPELTAPANNTLFTQELLQDNSGLIFFTWTKTNFTTVYEFELSSDAQFSKILSKKTLRDNYQSILPPSTGKLFWRVRALSNGVWSDFSETRSLTINP